MASPGWYPDPSGQPNRFRFWDGRSWSEQTTMDPWNTPPPGQAPPGPPAQQPQQPGQSWQPGQPGPPGQPGQGWTPGPVGGSTGPGSGEEKSGKKTLLAIIGVVVVIVLIIGGIFAVKAFTGDDDELDKSDSDKSSQPNDSTEDPSEDSSESQSSDPQAEGTDPESESSDPDAESARPAVGNECTAGNPTKRVSKDGKGRIVGGGLSFAKPKGYKDLGLEGAFAFSHDAAVTAKSIEAYWASTMMVGELRRVDGFKSAKQAADAVVNCMAASDDFYSGFESRKDLVSEKGSVDKAPAWRIRSEIRVDEPRVQAEGDLADVIVVKLDAKRFGVFIGVVPLGDAALKKVLKKAVKTLHVK
ncbi:MAG: DUF2510 domain-containing protein [Nocardioides sp.]|nr:DUF2510 domain-containing protein [Nocardioides sp.]